MSTADWLAVANAIRMPASGLPVRRFSTLPGTVVSCPAGTLLGQPAIEVRPK